ncbi:MAG: DUF86 domain-containing protein, partial [Nitrospinae bacterium]|nr:DUF86 domain-containing protein [Nitrospinota bacterium]
FNKGVAVFFFFFEILEKEGFLASDLAMKLKKMVKFRNKLIHRYWEIDDKNILEYSRKDINDFNDFMKAVGRLIN